MQNPGSNAKAHAAALRLTRLHNKAARADLMASEAVPDKLRPGWEAAVAASAIKNGRVAFFGSTRRRLEAKLIKADVPLSVISEFERLGLILFYSTISGEYSNYIFVNLEFPNSYPDEYTSEQRQVALKIIDKHRDEFQPYEHTAAVYAVACSFAIPGGQLRFSLVDLLMFLDVYSTFDFSKFQEVIKRWKDEGVIKKLIGVSHYLMFDYNYLTGDWGSN